MKRNKGFTLTELLIVLGVLAVLSTIIIIFINPTQFVAQGRDAQRISDVKRIETAVKLVKGSLYEYESLVDNTLPNVVYVSLPDTLPYDDLCDEYTLPSLASGWSYRCVAPSADLKKVDGNGWIPINFNSV